MDDLLTNPDPQARRGALHPRVVIAGFGLVCPLGDGAWPTFAALLSGRTLADRAAALPEDVAPVDLARALGCVVSVQHNRADPAVCLAERAAREATTMAGVSLAGLGLWLGTSKGAIAHLSQALGKGRPITDDVAACVALGPHASMAQQLSHRLGTTNVCHHVAACSSALVALDAARRALIQQPRDASPYALVASADAAITPAFVHSYRRLGVLGDMTAKTYRQYPLDERRQGFMLSEMGVAVLLKRIEPDAVMPEGALELVDTLTGCEPYDMVRSPAEMVGLSAMWHRLSAGRSIELIHPHAPGTPDHDPAELSVLLRTPSPAKPWSGVDGSAGAGATTDVCADVYAVKGAIGHGLGASGLASLVVAAMSLRAGRRPPMPWLREPMKLPCGRRLETDAGARVCSRTGSQAVLAAGFGGHLAAAVLQGHGKPPPLT